MTKFISNKIACALICLIVSFPAKADTTLDAVMARLDKLENQNKKMADEIIELKQRNRLLTASHTGKINTLKKQEISEQITPIPIIQTSQTPPTGKQWQGIYAGIFAGYGGNSINTSSMNYAPSQNGSGTGLIGYNTSNFGAGGPLAGAQIGYNHVLPNNIVIGAESDIAYSDIYNFNGSRGSSSGTTFTTPATNQKLAFSSYDRTGLNWLGTTRIRAGYALGNFLPYISGGISYGELSSSTLQTNYVDIFSCSTCANGPLVSRTSGYTDKFQVGWALGAGGEYMLANAWSLKAEYLYTSLGGISRNDYTLASFAPATSSFSTGAFGVHQARVGLNYHTDWLASKPAVAAKY